MARAEWLDKDTLRIVNGLKYRDIDSPSEDTLSALEFIVDVPNNPWVAPTTTIEYYTVSEQTDEFHTVAISHWWSKEDAEREAKAGSGWYGAPNTVTRNVLNIKGTPPAYQKEQ